ncbi:MAG: EAL domain-containing protein [Micropruina sp.]
MLTSHAVGADELRAALGAGEIVPWYQPIIDLTSGDVHGVEALARWHRPDGLLSPADFVPLAEASDMVIELDLAVIRQALADLGRWQHTRPGFELNVNVSGRHLDSSTGVAQVIAAVEEAGVPPGSVCIELTESARPASADVGAAGLDTLRGHGLPVWLDDFGSGYYGLRDLIRLPVNGIKFDRSFTAELNRPRTAPLIGALTEAAHRMGLRVTVEGIETATQAAAVRQLGCDLGQGYLWSPALSAEKLEGWLSTSTPAVPA